ncbi:unnamed protein product, partial [Polarella glacialis]
HGHSKNEDNTPGNSAATTAGSGKTASSAKSPIAWPSLPAADAPEAAPVGCTDPVLWEKLTQSSISNVRALRQMAQFKLSKGLQQSSRATLSDESILGGASYTTAQDRLKRRNQNSEGIANAVLDRMEATDHLIHRVGQRISELQRSSGILFAALSVVEKRLDMRASRPPTEMVRDGFQEALEREKAALLKCRQQLCSSADEGREVLASLEMVKAELGRDRHMLPLDRSSRPQQLLAKARSLEGTAMRFCSDIGSAARIKVEVECEADRATGRTHTAMKRRLAELVEVRRQLESEIKETSGTIAEAEWHFQRSSKMLTHFNAQPEKGAGDNSHDAHLEQMRDLFQSPFMMMMRAKIKGAAYVGHGGRQLDTLFSRFDRDNSGQLDEDEVRKALRRTLRIPPSAVTDAEIATLCGHLDADKSGEVSIQELVSFLSADMDPKALTEQIQSAKHIIENLKPALESLQADLRCKTAAWKVDEGCTRVTPIKGLELDGAPGANRPGRSQTARTPRAGRRPCAPLSPDLQDKIRSKIKAAAYTGSAGLNLDMLFARFDKDGTGQLDDDELRIALRRVLRIAPTSVSDDEIRSLCALLDADCSGSVSIQEIVDFIGAEPESRRQKSLLGAPLEPIKLAEDREVESPRRPRKKGPPLAQEQIEKLKAKIKGATYTGTAGKQLDVVFGRFDKDGSGQLDDDEVRKALRRSLRIPPAIISDNEISSLCALLDADNSGTVSIQELVDFVGMEEVSKRTGKSFLGRKLEPMSPELNSMRRPESQGGPRQVQSR